MLWMRKRPVCSTQSSMKRIAQSMLGFRLGKIRAFDDETIFAHFFGLLSRSFLDKNAAGRCPDRLNFTTEQRKNRSYMHYRTYFLHCLTGLFLPCAGVLPVQRFTQPREVRIESHETSRALEERPATSLIAQPVE